MRRRVRNRVERDEGPDVEGFPPEAALELEHSQVVLEQASDRQGLGSHGGGREDPEQDENEQRDARARMSRSAEQTPSSIRRVNGAFD
jgi:hypothetical protein